MTARSESFSPPQLQVFIVASIHPYPALQYNPLYGGCAVITCTLIGTILVFNLSLSLCVSVFRSLLQQLQKLQSLISGKVVPRSCKMASTQTGTCLMVNTFFHAHASGFIDTLKLNEMCKLVLFLSVQMMAVCFVLVLGSFSPCLSPLSFLTHSSSLSSAPSSSASPQSADLYTTSRGRWRNLFIQRQI